VRSHGAGYRAMNLQESMGAPEPSGPVTEAGESGRPAASDKGPAAVSVADRAANDPKEAAGTTASAARAGEGALAPKPEEVAELAARAESDEDEEMAAAGSDTDEDEQMAAESDADRDEQMAVSGSNTDDEQMAAAESDTDEDDEMAAGSDADEDEQMAVRSDADEDEEMAAESDTDEDDEMAAGSDTDEDEETAAESDTDEDEEIAAGSDSDEDDAAARSDPDEDDEMAAGSDPDEDDEMAAESDADEDEETAAESDPDEDDEMAAESDPDKDEELAAGSDPDKDEELAAGSDPDKDEEMAAAVIAAERAGTDAALAGAVDPDFRTLKRHHVSPAMIAIDRIDDDGSFRVRHEGDISQLATDLARLGQLFPVDVRLKAPDRFQIICGFRRVAALRFLQRDRVLARLHTDLSDEDALLMALTSAIHAQPVTAKELEEVKQRLEAEGKLTPATRSMIEKALAPGDDLAPESVEGEEEVDADELAEQVAFKLGEINQDLSLLAGVFESLDEAKRAELLEQLRYAADLVEFLEGQR
jgi:ParB family chromosome partitioning protein